MTGDWLLAFDLSTPRGTLVLDGPDGALSREIAGHERTAGLFVEIKAMLEKADIRREDVAILGVGRGPGSFTGVRVAVTAAKTLAYALGVPLTAPESLAVRAAGAGSRGGAVFVALDARRGEVYYGMYRLEEGCPRPVLEPRAASPERAAAELKSFLEREGTEVAVTGTGIAPHPGVWPAGVQVVDGEPPAAEGLARACRMAAERGELVDPLELLPLYIRRPDLGRTGEERGCSW